MRLRGKKVLVSDKDVWSCDSTLGPIIVAVLKKFKSNSDKAMFGVPSMIYQDFAIAMSSDEGHTEEDDKSAMQTWLAVIDDMIFAFEYDEYTTNKYWDDYSKTIEIRTTELVEGTEVEVVNVDMDMKEKFETEGKILFARYERGMLYFAKYYKCLWW